MEVLAQQQALYDVLSTPAYRSYLQNFCQDVVDKNAGPIVFNKDRGVSGDVMADHQRQVLKMAEAFQVTEEMVAVTWAAADGLDDLDRFAHDLWPTEHGFCWFDGGVDMQDVWGKSMPFHAMTWERRRSESTGTPGFFCCFYTLFGDSRDQLWADLDEAGRLRLLADLGRLQIVHTAFFADERRVGPATVNYVEQYPDYQQYAPAGATMSKQVFNNTRFMLALLMLLGQTITSTQRHDLRPANPKRARRMKVPGAVTVITLRHAKHIAHHDQESSVEWSHRWVVRGHWRSQHCGPHHPGAQEVAPGQYRTRIWIAPFVKGPEDRPLVVRSKVNRLSR